MLRHRRALLLALLVLAPPASAADFYADKSITLLVAAGAGGGFDTYSRFFARYFGEHVPGKPSIIVQNKPGAGGLVATGYAYNVAPKDGTMLLEPNPINTLQPLLDPAKANFDARRFNWIGSLNKEIKVCAFWSDKVKSVEDLKTKDLVLAGSGPASGSTIDAKALQKLLGFRFTLISGYADTGSSEHASRRGETDGFCGLAVSRLKNTLRDEYAKGEIRVPIQMAVERHPDLPNVPTVFDLVTSEETRQVLTMLYAPWSYGQPIAAPPGVPQDRVQILRDAFKATLQDPKLISEAQRIHMEVNWMPGAEINEVLETIYKSSGDVVAKARDIYGVRD